jgi:hypothetical protein
MSAALRIIDIKGRAIPLDLSADTPAARYVRCFGVPADAMFLPSTLSEHPNLDHWASPSRQVGSFPALIAMAQGPVSRSLHAIFLTHDGRLAPITHPRLLMGTLNGACVPISQSGDPTTLWVTKSIETALRVAFSGERRYVVAALLPSNMPRLDVLSELGVRRVMLACSGEDETRRKQDERAHVLKALRARGLAVEVVMVAAERQFA